MYVTISPHKRIHIKSVYKEDHKEVYSTHACITFSIDS